MFLSKAGWMEKRRHYEDALERTKQQLAKTPFGTQEREILLQQERHNAYQIKKATIQIIRA